MEGLGYSAPYSIQDRVALGIVLSIVFRIVLAVYYSVSK